MVRCSSCVVALGVSLAIGCGSAPTPTAQIASTEAAIRSAQEVGAEATPRAALHLHYARDQQANAQRLIEAHKMDEATLQLRRAQADAEVSIAIAREANATRQANALVDQVRSSGGSH
jgi:hypothetical protein